MNLTNGDNTFTVELVDNFGYKYTESRTIKIGNSNTSSSQTNTNIDPQITTTNPRNSDSRISLYAGDSFNLRFSITVGTESREISITLDDKTIQNATAGDVFVVPVSTSGFSVGNHTLKIKLIDGNLKTTERKIILSILAR